MNKEKIYFGHPVNSYNTQLEENLVALINKTFPEYEVLNPNQKIHNDGYQKYKAETGKGMDYYYDNILPTCKLGIFLSFPEGTFGAGVGGEANWFEEQGKEVFSVDYEGNIDTRSVTSMGILSVPETIKRVYDFDYKGSSTKEGL